MRARQIEKIRCRFIYTSTSSKRRRVRLLRCGRRARPRPAALCEESAAGLLEVECWLAPPAGEGREDPWSHVS
jgi:hypothetical protein